MVDLKVLKEKAENVAGRISHIAHDGKNLLVKGGLVTLDKIPCSKEDFQNLYESTKELLKKENFFQFNEKVYQKSNFVVATIVESLRKAGHYVKVAWNWAKGIVVLTGKTFVLWFNIMKNKITATKGVLSKETKDVLAKHDIEVEETASEGDVFSGVMKMMKGKSIEEMLEVANSLTADLQKLAKEKEEEVISDANFTDLSPSANPA